MANKAAIEAARAELANNWFFQHRDEIKATGQPINVADEMVAHKHGYKNAAAMSQFEAACAKFRGTDIVEFLK